jgi:hypothetical protein
MVQSFFFALEFFVGRFQPGIETCFARETVN